MKTCYKCKETKQLEEFSNNRAKSDGRNNQCKICHAKYRHEHYIKNHKKARQQIEKRKLEYREWVRSFKEKPCTDCGQSYPYYVMDFDHLPEFKKSFHMAHAWMKAKQTVLDEVKKCEVVCSNCHRERTHQRRV